MDRDLILTLLVIALSLAGIGASVIYTGYKYKKASREYSSRIDRRYHIKSNGDLDEVR